MRLVGCPLKTEFSAESMVSPAISPIAGAMVRPVKWSVPAAAASIPAYPTIPDVCLRLHLNLVCGRSLNSSYALLLYPKRLFSSVVFSMCAVAYVVNIRRNPLARSALKLYGQQ